MVGYKFTSLWTCCVIVLHSHLIRFQLRWMNRALAASMDANHWCLYCSGNLSSLERGHFISNLALFSNRSTPHSYARHMFWLTCTSRMACLLASSSCNALLQWFHISHAVINRWVNRAIVHHWLDFWDLNAFQYTSCSLCHLLAKHPSRARPHPMLSWIWPAEEPSVKGWQPGVWSCHPQKSFSSSVQTE